MQIQGTVLGVRDGSYTSKKDSKVIAQLNIDIYDATSGLQPCTITGLNVAPPPVKSEVVAEVTAIRKINFGVGYVLTIANIRVLNDGAPPASKPPR